MAFEASQMPSSDEIPIIAMVTKLRADIEAETEKPYSEFTFEGLIRVIGAKSHALVLLIFSLLNTLPAPPGYNFLMGLLLIATATMLLLGVEIRLWRPLGRIRLSIKLVHKLVDALVKIAEIAAKFSSPRLQFVTGPAAVRLLCVFGIILGVATLPPIPAGNLLPSIALAVICLGVLNRDGLVVLAGVGIGILGLLTVAAVLWLVWSAFAAVGEVVEDLIDTDPGSDGHQQ